MNTAGSISNMRVAENQLTFSSTDFRRLTHYLFRYPAKFHPPVAHSLITRYSHEGDVILDPFCGSGTLLVEASVLGRSGIGIDVDPLAVFVSRAKTLAVDFSTFIRSARQLDRKLIALARPDEDYQRLIFGDLASDEYAFEIATCEGNAPDIPNIFHWFRRYVVVDLVRIKDCIRNMDVPDDIRQILLLVFAAIIRNVSNADPVPVSGLEVTAHMKRKELQGRKIDPFRVFRKQLTKTVAAVEQYLVARNHATEIDVHCHDATDMTSALQRLVDVIITSPPYANAVDYYRRHKLEMFWLDLTESQSDRLALLPHYIGQPKVAKRHPFLVELLPENSLSATWERLMRDVSCEKADAFRHYCVAMGRVFDQLGHVVKPGGTAVFVVGHSTWNGSELPTSDLFIDLARPIFDLVRVEWYSVKNRYMSYSRRNSANIDKEYVLVLKRNGGRQW